MIKINRLCAVGPIAFLMRITSPSQLLLTVVFLFSACSITPDKETSLSEIQMAFNFGLAAYEDGDFEGALASWLPLAKSGNAESAFRVADMYDYAHGVQQDYKESAKWFLRAADRGHGEAQFRIAGRYDSGTGVKKDISKAYKWYLLSQDNLSTTPRSRYWAGIYLRTYFSVGLLSSDQISRIEKEAKEWEPIPNLE